MATAKDLRGCQRNIIMSVAIALPKGIDTKSYENELARETLQFLSNFEHLQCTVYN